VAPFYPLRRRLFYGLHATPDQHCFNAIPLRFCFCFEVKKIIHRMPEILLASKIVFCGLHGNMPEQELDLLKLTTIAVAKFRASSSQVVRCNVLQARSLAASSDYVPDNVLRDAPAPHRLQPRDCSKDFAVRNSRGSCPLIESGLHPVRNGHRANVTTLADQINRGPVPLAHLDVIQLQADQLRSAKTTTEQHGQHCIIALGTHTVATSSPEHFRTLLCTQPVVGAKPELLDSPDATDPRRQLRTQQTGVGGLVSETTHGCKLLIDGIRR